MLLISIDYLVLLKYPYPFPFHFVCACVISHVWLCEPMDYSLPISSVLGIFQARILRMWLSFNIHLEKVLEIFFMFIFPILCHESYIRILVLLKMYFAFVMKFKEYNLPNLLYHFYIKFLFLFPTALSGMY